MTDSENKNIVTLLHEMEVRFTERLTRIEAEASAWRKTHEDMRVDIDRVSTEAKEAAKDVAATQAADSLRMSTETRRVEDECNSRIQRLTIALVAVSIVAVGRLGINVFQFFT